MTKELQFRRGNTAEHTLFTGAPAEITVNTDNYVAIVHDGQNNGGFPLVGSAATQTITNKTVIAGSSSTTGTASQPLQVVGGAYVSGNLGVGSTNPTYKVSVVGDINFTGSLYQNGNIFTSGGGGGQFVTTSVGIHTLSNVGVGTTNPTSKLTVTGDGRFTGIVTAANFNSSSDINLKENIHTVENSLETIQSLRGVSFDWKESGKKSYGVIAQELEEILPELVSSGEIKTVNYNGIIGVLIEAVKELKREIEDLKNHKYQ
jgi:two-component sensor histidine kinase